MQFTLYYDGPLPSNGRPAAKAYVRSKIEPQLRELWAHPPWSEYPGLREPGDASAVVERNGHVFLANVTKSLDLRAELDVLIQWPSTVGGVVHEGDIDNRLKTLFDALSAPTQLSQVPAEMRHTSVQDPMYVLVEDDSLISRVNVEAERLLAPSQPSEVRLTMRVRTRAVRSSYANLPFA